MVILFTTRNQVSLRFICSDKTGEAKLWILLVGVNSYQDDAFRYLRYPTLDCQGLGEALLLFYFLNTFNLFINSKSLDIFLILKI
ncbi:hypothetical protein NIES2101_17830 [Calothrix sp. HK-06]|nr:hypothetical protein NIES2101_17830 [Calothrix sp. HK-06]